MSKLWSHARQRKYDFCPRAFFYQYHHDQNSYSHKIFSQEAGQQLALFSVKKNLLRALFYDRTLSFTRIQSLKNHFIHKYELNELHKLSLDKLVKNFRHSTFFAETSPALVNHLEIDNVTSVQLSDISVLGTVDLAWTQPCGTVNLIKFSNAESSNADLSFLLYYALKKLHIDLHRLNTGSLYFDNISKIHWQHPDWQALEAMQDKALSFNYSKEPSDFPPTDEISHCQYCRFASICPDSSL